jgi:hypothetical protein
MAAKTLPCEALRTVWDDLGCFRLADVPLLFPDFKPARLLRTPLSTPASAPPNNTTKLQRGDTEDCATRQG